MRLLRLISIVALLGICAPASPARAQERAYFVTYDHYVGGLGAIMQAAQVREHDRRWVAPTSAASKPNPLPDRPELAAGGRKIFVERCTQCHGEDAQGTSRAPNLLSSRVQAQTDGALFWKISSGDTRRGMPAFSFLPETQRWQLVLYLRGLHGSSAHVG